MPKKNKKKNLNHRERCKGNQIKNGLGNLKKLSSDIDIKSRNVLKPENRQQTDGNLFDILEKIDPQNGKNLNRKKKKLQALTDLSLVRSKLSIGDDDSADAGECGLKLPESRPYCKLNVVPDDVFNMIVGYVQNYFNHFDNKRDQLLDAYTPRSLFSLSVSLNKFKSKMFAKVCDFKNHAMENSRNLNRLFDTQKDKAWNVLQRGHLDILNFLCKYPETEHEPSSFKLENCFFTPHLISFSLTGTFREGALGDKERPVRSFQRVFVCIPDVNTKMKIINEQFIVSHLPKEQFRKYYTKTSQACEQKHNLESLVSNYPKNMAFLNSTELKGDFKMEHDKMIEKFSIETRLNLEWSKYCLEHVKWNYDEASKVLSEFRAKLPKEAFLQ